MNIGYKLNVKFAITTEKCSEFLKLRYSLTGNRFQHVTYIHMDFGIRLCMEGRGGDDDEGSS